MLLLMLKRPWTWMMSVRRGWLACAAFALMSHPAYAADLLGAYRQALENDANFLAARANAEATREAVPQARAGLLPNLSFSGSRTKNNTDITQNTILGPRTSHSDYVAEGQNLTLRQPPYRRADPAHPPPARGAAAPARGPAPAGGGAGGGGRPARAGRGPHPTPGRFPHRGRRRRGKGALA